jgi:hypothetical protein
LVKIQHTFSIVAGFYFRCNFAYNFGMSAKAWVVKCPTCHCVIVAFARDPQLEHGKTEAVLAPANSCVLECMCCGSAYRYSGDDLVQGVPKRNPVCLRKQQPTGKMDRALLVAASIVAAIRLRGQEITRSPKLVAVVSDSILLARTVMAAIERDR